VSPKTLRALIYNRVSADASGRRVSVDSQDRENRAWCTREGWNVAATITDNDRSASRFAGREREGYAQVKTALAGRTHGRIDVLVCWESSRAQRGLGDYTVVRDLCDQHGVLFAYGGRAYDLRDLNDRLATGLHALMDEQEAEKIRNRILRSHRDSVLRGTPRGVTPYGYQRNYDPHSGRMVGQSPHPDTAPIVREIADRILRGDTLYAVAQDLNRREVTTPRGHRDRQAGLNIERPGWSSSMIRNLMAKQSLAGIRTHHGHVTGEATWPALISPDRWTAVQAVLADPGRARAQTGRAPRYLLSGIAECAVCGAWLRPLTNRGRGTYVCAGATPTSPKGHVARLRRPLDVMVTAVLLDRLSRPTFLAWYTDLIGAEDGVDEGVREAQAELSALEGRLTLLEESLADPEGITPARFAKAEADLTPKIADARRRTTPGQADPLVLEVAGPDAVATWERWSTSGLLSRQRQVARALLRVVVDRNNGPRGSHEFDVSSVALSWRGRRGLVAVEDEV